MVDIQKFLSGYIKAALWSTTGNYDEEGNEWYLLDDEFDSVSEKCKNAMLSDCEDFVTANSELLEEFKKETGADDWRLGLLFWLDREGHGSGFWDEKSNCASGDSLSDACQPYGSFPLYGDFDDGIVKSHYYG